MINMKVPVWELPHGIFIIRIVKNAHFYRHLAIYKAKYIEPWISVFVLVM